jgi:hypothetical protein
VQSLDGFVFGEFGVTDFGLQVAREALGFPQRPFGFFAGGGFRGQGGFGALQAAAGGDCRCGDAAVRWCFVSRVSPQHCYGDIAILDEAPAVQSTVESITHAGLLVGSFGVGAVALGFTEQAEGFSHL